MSAAVIELLRCAADLNSPLDAATGFCLSAGYVGCSKQTRERACEAFEEINGKRGNDWSAACLEVAARIEERSWP